MNSTEIKPEDNIEELELPFDSIQINMEERRAYICLRDSKLVFVDLPPRKDLKVFRIGGFRGITTVKLQHVERKEEDGRLQET